MSLSDAALGTIAFGSRILFRPRTVLGERIPERSRAYLERLDAPPESFRSRLARRALRDEVDLLDESAADDPDALRLQVRLLELAPMDPFWERYFRKVVGRAPIFRLFAAFLAQARAEGADALVFESSEDRFLLRLRFGEAEKETKEIPENLQSPLRGHGRFLQAGLSRLRAYGWLGPGWPADLRFEGQGERWTVHFA